MIEQSQAAPVQDRPTPTVTAVDRIAASVAHYRALGAQHLCDRGSLNGLMLNLLDGRRDGTVEEFAALSHAHELLTAELGSALACLGAVVNCKGSA